MPRLTLTALILTCVGALAFAQTGQPTKPAPNNVRRDNRGDLVRDQAAIKAAEINRDAQIKVAKINAAASISIGNATQDQIRESGSHQFWATIATGSVLLLGTIATAYGAYLNKRRLSEDVKENERKRLEARFVDIQNRLTSSNDQERTNAVHALADFALQVDPEFLPRPKRNRARLAMKMRLAVGFTPLLEDGSLRPCSTAHPFFKPAVQRLGAILVLEEHQTVRNAAVRAVQSLADFAAREANGIQNLNAITLNRRQSLIPLTKFLIEEVATVNREAYAQWITSWAEFVAAATVFGGSTGTTEIDWDNYEESKNFPHAQKPKLGEPRGDFNARTFEKRRAHLMASVDPEYYGDGPIDWSADYKMWTAAVSLCPFVIWKDIDEYRRQVITSNFLLDAADEPSFEEQWWGRVQLLKSLGNSNEFKQKELSEFRQRLAINASRLISTRDALASALQSAPIDRAAVARLRALLNGKSDQWSSYVTFNISRTILIGADLMAARFPAATVTGATFPAAKLQGSYFEGAEMDQTWFPKAQLDDSAWAWIIKSDTRPEDCVFPSDDEE